MEWLSSPLWPVSYYFPDPESEERFRNLTQLFLETRSRSQEKLLALRVFDTQMSQRERNLVVACMANDGRTQLGGFTVSGFTALRNVLLHECFEGGLHVFTIS